MENGERKWKDLSRKYGLMRCGNSCRRRWFNHLRSNLKKEDFTAEEENKILKLHAKYGNRWSRIAGHLPRRSDNEIKNYWNIRLRRLVRARLPIYPPEIQQEVRHQLYSSYLKPKQSPQNLSSFSSSTSSTFQENYKNFKFIPSSHQKNTTSITSSSFQEDPDLNSFKSMPLKEAMSKYPLLVASLYPLLNMYNSSLLHSVSSGGVSLSPPPSSPHLNYSNSTYTPLFAESQLAPKSDVDTIQMDDSFLSENFDIEIPSIQSCFDQAITPNDHYNNTSKGDQNNYNMDQERNSGLLEDILRQSTTLLSSHNGSTASMNHPNGSNANLESVFGSSANDMNHVDESVNDTGVISEASGFENINMMDDDFVDFPPSGPLQELYIISNDWEDYAQELMGSQIAITPLEQDQDWDLGYMPIFS